MSDRQAIARQGPRIPQPSNAKMAPEQWRVLVDAIFPGAKTAQAVVLAVEYCNARKLDIFKRPVHIVSAWNSQLGAEVETIWPGISELEVTASRTGQWAGMDIPAWGPDITRHFAGDIGPAHSRKRVEFDLTYPEWCSVTVYRMKDGQRCPFAGQPVYWDETYATANRWTDIPNEMWRKRKRGQLYKCALAASLRSAFPEEMGNDYAAEEMEGKPIDGGVVIDGKAERHAEPARKTETPALIQKDWFKEAQDLLATSIDEVDWVNSLRDTLQMVETVGQVTELRSLPAVKTFYKNAAGSRQTLIQGYFRQAVDRLSPKEDHPPSGGEASPPSGVAPRVGPSASPPESDHIIVVLDDGGAETAEISIRDFPRWFIKELVGCANPLALLEHNADAMAELTPAERRRVEEAYGERIRNAPVLFPPSAATDERTPPDESPGITADADHHNDHIERGLTPIPVPSTKPNAWEAYRQTAQEQIKKLKSDAEVLAWEAANHPIYKGRATEIAITNWLRDRRNALTAAYVTGDPA